MWLNRVLGVQQRGALGILQHLQHAAQKHDATTPLRCLRQWGAAPGAPAACTPAGQLSPPCAQQHAAYAIDTTKRAYIPSRKPAVKKPAAHQWHFCNVDYDPNKPLPKNMVPPYAPAWAHDKDYTKPFKENKPRHGRNRYRRGWNKNRLIALERWKQAWQERLAIQDWQERTVRRKRERIQRRIAWGAWQDWQAYQQQQAARGEQQQQQQLALHAGSEGAPAAGADTGAAPKPAG